MMVRCDAAGVRLLTRNGHDWADPYPLIADAADALGVRSCLIDGEAVACDGDGMPVFDRLRYGPPSRARTSVAGPIWTGALLRSISAVLKGMRAYGRTGRMFSAALITREHLAYNRFPRLTRPKRPQAPKERLI
jgi:hypothetical protein